MVISDTPFGATEVLTINGTASGETLTLDLSGLNTFPTGAFTFNGVAGGPNTLVIQGLDSDNAVYNFSSATGGNVLLSSGGKTFTVNDTGVTSVTDHGAVSDAVFNLTSAGDDLILEDAGNGLAQLQSLNGTFETVTFANPTGSVTINGGSGPDKFDLSS